MTLVAPRPQGLTRPGRLSGSSTAALPAQDATVPAAAPSAPSAPAKAAPVPAAARARGDLDAADRGVEPGPDSAPDAFQAHLMAVVESEMGKLTEARAVDEWHREVLDPRIAAEVDQECRRIERVAHERLTALKGQQAATRAHRAQLEAHERAADEGVSAALAEVAVSRAQVHAHASGAPMGDPGPGGLPRPDVDGQLAAVRAQVAVHREGIQRALRSAGVKTEQELSSAVQTAQRGLADLERQVSERRLDLERSEAHRVAAHDRFRGVATAAAQPTPAQPTPAQPTPAQPAATGPGAHEPAALAQPTIDLSVESR